MTNPPPNVDPQIAEQWSYCPGRDGFGLGIAPDDEEDVRIYYVNPWGKSGRYLFGRFDEEQILTLILTLQNALNPLKADEESE